MSSHFYGLGQWENIFYDVWPFGTGHITLDVPNIEICYLVSELTDACPCVVCLIVWKRRIQSILFHTQFSRLSPNYCHFLKEDKCRHIHDHSQTHAFSRLRHFISSFSYYQRGHSGKSRSGLNSLPQIKSNICLSRTVLNLQGLGLVLNRVEYLQLPVMLALSCFCCFFWLVTFKLIQDQSASKA